MPLLEITSKGLYCSQGDFFIDPWQPVNKAIITHAHSDHARSGSTFYLSHTLSEPILRLRLGAEIQLQTLPYGEQCYINGVTITLFPAGHIIGSAQVRVEYQGEVWVVSGDYKVENDGISDAFEPVPCHTFITECTFGLPIFRWAPQEDIFNDIHTWWKKNKEEEKTSILFGYPLGKTQRLLAHLSQEMGPIFAHGAVQNVNEAFRNIGIPLPQLETINKDTDYRRLQGAMVLAPPSAIASLWMRKFKHNSTAVVSGWMNLRGAKRRRPVDKGFVLSDHADWPGLLTAIQQTGASTVITTHGYKSAFSKYLIEKGYQSYEINTWWDEEASANEDFTTPNEGGEK